MTNDPEIQTLRLALRPVIEADVPALHAHWTAPGVRRYLWDGQVIDMKQVEDVVAASDALFREHGAGLWSVRERDGGTLVGCAGFWFFHDPPELELLVSIDENRWRRGYGREVATALIDHALVALGWPFVQASTDAPNEASIRLMEALLMEPAGTRPGEFGEIRVYRKQTAAERA